MSKVIEQVRIATISLDRCVIPERDGAIQQAYCALTDAYARILELENFVRDIAGKPNAERLENYYFRRAAELVKD